VRNLLENAARHARTAVSLEVVAQGGRVILAVEDDGPGIPVSDRDRVFERFSRLEDARSSGEGVGLGLAVVKRIVERHGGKVGATESHALGGARFEVVLPAFDADSTAEAQAEQLGS
jgi:signal transduction histidine kinase